MKKIFAFIDLALQHYDLTRQDLEEYKQHQLCGDVSRARRVIIHFLRFNIKLSLSEIKPLVGCKSNNSVQYGSKHPIDEQAYNTIFAQYEAKLSTV